ncbi:G-patch domain-containing protein [Chloropicon primus]|uniref:G-patch domain-containing protein n=2 Tax=Chloropicon primus TaxID=1764295 RepID=A0A5B8MNZ4_9CHLO|nr:hypothetical protein A3770_06p42520 [Chloropicon primus]UPR00956.1 G-patch domain-containing protein [Chloropicon primus]|eukprot:QDZ21734.1 hypothetical protein A3770_06p42520 [Chloropicon primus]
MDCVLDAELEASVSGGSSIDSEEEENIDLLVTAFENKQLGFQFTTGGECLVESESEGEGTESDSEGDEDEDGSSGKEEGGSGRGRELGQQFPVSSGEHHRRREHGRAPTNDDSEGARSKKSKKGRKGKKEKQRKRGEKQEKRKKRIQSKRAQRLEGNKGGQFNLRSIANKLIYFIEEVDDDTFEFPPIPNQLKQSGSSRLAVKFLTKLSRALELKVVTLHKMKKFILIGAMRTRKTPVFVSEDHRDTVKGILKEWNDVKSPPAPAREGRPKEDGDDGGDLGEEGGSAATSSKSQQSFGEFEKHTLGFGSRMLEKMGFIQGAGLGKDNQGSNQPLQAQLRKKKLGLGAD